MRSSISPRALATRLIVLGFALLSSCQVLFGDVQIDDAGVGNEPEVPICEVGEFRCNGEYLLECQAASAGWVLSDTCATAERCDSRAKHCNVCKEGDYRCNGAARETCNTDGGSWRELERCESEAVCSPTQCGPCIPGEHQCAGAEQRELRECGPSETWVTLELCLTGPLCDASLDLASQDPETWSKTCAAPGCTEPGKYLCDGPRLLRCPHDQTRWTEVDVCATTALCERGATDANLAIDSGGSATVDMCPQGCPTAGAFLCNGATLRQCSADLTGWVDVRTCEPGTQCNPGRGDCTPPCTPGEYQCNGTELRRCRDDQTFEVVQNCATAALCNAVRDVNGNWSGSCRAPVCPRAGDYRCSGANLSECNLDQTAWDPRDVCASAALCNAASKRCEVPACGPDEFRCFGSELKHCMSDLTAFETLQTCDAGEYCDNNPSSAGCKTTCPGSSRCNGRLLEYCTPELGWTTGATCTTTDLCQCALADPDGSGVRTNSCAAGVNTNGCGKALCAANAYQCAGAVLQQCQVGRNAWSTGTNCGSVALCEPGPVDLSTPGFCANCPLANELRCAPSASGSEVLRCAADRRSQSVAQTCTEFPCLDSGTSDYCAVCNAGTYQCDSVGRLQTCRADMTGWDTQQACAARALCDAAHRECDDCAPPAFKCNAQNELSSCDATGHYALVEACGTTRTCSPTQGACLAGGSGGGGAGGGGAGGSGTAGDTGGGGVAGQATGGEGPAGADMGGNAGDAVGGAGGISAGG